MHTAGVTEIEFDSAKAKENLRKHGVHLADAEQALPDDRAVTIEDPDAQNERRYVTLGMDSLGRLLVVVHTPRGGKTRIIFGT